MGIRGETLLVGVLPHSAASRGLQPVFDLPERERASQGINIPVAIPIPCRGRASIRAGGSGSGGAPRKRLTQVEHM